MDKLKEKVLLSNSAIIFGAGAIANITYLYLKNCELSDRIVSFVVTTKENNADDKFGIPVRELDEIKEYSRDILIIVATQEIVQAEIVENLKGLEFNNVIRVASDEILKALYQSCYIQPVQKNKVLFSNMRGLGYGGNPKYIAQKLLDMDKGNKLDLVWAVTENSDVFPDGIRTVEYGSLDYYRELATAHIWIDNMRKSADVIKRDGQYYIQAWHGAAPFKMVEKDAEKSLSEPYIQNAKNDSKMADLFLSGSEFYTKLYQNVFWYDGEIMKVGLPRQDIFWNMDYARQKIIEYYKLPSDILLVLYAPTFRNSFDTKVYDLDFTNVRHAIEKRFEKKVVFAVSKHPNNRSLSYCFDYSEECIDVSQYDDFEEVLAAADILITDYSGCAYDFSFSGKPIFLYQSDYEEFFGKERNFYFGIEGLPYIHAKSNDELIKEIGIFDENKYKQELDKFMDSMGNYDTGQASEKVALHIMKLCDIIIE